MLVFTCLERDIRHDDKIIAQQKPFKARKKSIATFGAIAKKQNENHSEQTGKKDIGEQSELSREDW